MVRRTPKVSMPSSTTGGSPSRGSSLQKAKSCCSEEYKLTGAYNNKCRMCTVLYWLNPKRASRSKPGTGFGREERWPRKSCSGQPERFSVDSTPLSSPETRNLSNNTLISSAGSGPSLMRMRVSDVDHGGQRLGLCRPAASPAPTRPVPGRVANSVSLN